MSDTIYPEKIMRLLGLWAEYLRQKDDEGRRKVWDKAQRQLWATPNGGVVLWQVNFDAPVLPPVLDWREVCEIGKAVAA